MDIVDLSSCGFADWVGLGALAAQAGVHNLSLVGNKVADEAKEEGFEEFKAKVSLVLLGRLPGGRAWESGRSERWAGGARRTVAA